MATDRGSLRIKNWAAPAFWHPSHVLPNDATPHAAGNTTEALAFIAMTPCRVVDTRASQGFSGPFGAPALVGGSSRTFPVQSSTTCSIPTTTQAYSLNITVVPPAPLGFITAYPTGQPLPLAAAVNSPEGFIVGNTAIVEAGTSGSIDIFASNPTDVVIDINGYFASTSSGPIQSTNLLFHLMT